MLLTNNSVFRKMLLTTCIALVLMMAAAGSVFPVYLLSAFGIGSAHGAGEYNVNPFLTIAFDAKVSKIFNNSQKTGAPL